MRKIKALGSNLEDFELLEISNFLKRRFGFVETKSYCTILNYKCQNFNVDKKLTNWKFWNTNFSARFSGNLTLCQCLLSFVLNSDFAFDKKANANNGRVSCNISMVA